MTHLDTAEGLELHSEDGCLFVNVEDNPSIGASIICALHEEILEGNHGETVELDRRQMDQIDEWLDEYDE
jgi:hypothetical protein